MLLVDSLIGGSVLVGRYVSAELRRLLEFSFTSNVSPPPPTPGGTHVEPREVFRLGITELLRCEINPQVTTSSSGAMSDALQEFVLSTYMRQGIGVTWLLPLPLQLRPLHGQLDPNGQLRRLHK